MSRVLTVVWCYWNMWPAMWPKCKTMISSMVLCLNLKRFSITFTFFSKLIAHILKEDIRFIVFWLFCNSLSNLKCFFKLHKRARFFILKLSWNLKKKKKKTFSICFITFHRNWYSKCFWIYCWNRVYEQVTHISCGNDTVFIQYQNVWHKLLN